MKLGIILVLLGWLDGLADTPAEHLRKQIGNIVANKRATVGVAIMDLDGPDTLSLRGLQRFPMQSVFKFHLALAVLHQIDKGKWRLHEGVFVRKSELLPNTWSPLRDTYPRGDSTFALSELMKYSVSKSDNNACDILFDRVGGTAAVNQYLYEIGAKDVAVVATENEMHQAWDVQFGNWTTPLATVQLLEKFANRHLLSAESQAFLWRTMAETETGVNRLKKLLPKGTVVAHKTGTSGTNKAGLTAAINDAGIVVLPSGKRYAIAVYVTNTTETEQTNERIIAEISKAAWDYFVSK